jgi:hypothetical protein
MTESLRTRMYREEYGRGLNNYSEVYRLPADEEEWSRLGVCSQLPSLTSTSSTSQCSCPRAEKQHLMNIDMIGAKYPPPMGPVLQSNIPGEKKVLDLGCGSGAWWVHNSFRTGGKWDTNHHNLYTLKSIGYAMWPGTFRSAKLLEWT